MRRLRHADSAEVVPGRPGHCDRDRDRDRDLCRCAYDPASLTSFASVLSPARPEGPSARWRVSVAVWHQRTNRTDVLRGDAIRSRPRRTQTPRVASSNPTPPDPRAAGLPPCQDARPTRVGVASLWSRPPLPSGWPDPSPLDRRPSPKSRVDLGSVEGPASRSPCGRTAPVPVGQSSAPGAAVRSPPAYGQASAPHQPRVGLRTTGLAAPAATGFGVRSAPGAGPREATPSPQCVGSNRLG
jgi:hypothetical protein